MKKNQPTGVLAVPSAVFLLAALPQSAIEDSPSVKESKGGAAKTDPAGRLLMKALLEDFCGGCSDDCKSSSCNHK